MASSKPLTPDELDCLRALRRRPLRWDEGGWWQPGNQRIYAKDTINRLRSRGLVKITGAEVRLTLRGKVTRDKRVCLLCRKVGSFSRCSLRQSKPLVGAT
jgi:hypothetical protein